MCEAHDEGLEAKRSTDTLGWSEISQRSLLPLCSLLRLRNKKCALQSIGSFFPENLLRNQGCVLKSRKNGIMVLLRGVHCYQHIQENTQQKRTWILSVLCQQQSWNELRWDKPPGPDLQLWGLRRNQNIEAPISNNKFRLWQFFYHYFSYFL
jgi:hypothetical protein